MWLGAFIYTTFSLFSVAAWADDQHAAVGTYAGSSPSADRAEAMAEKCGKEANREPEFITTATMERICTIARCPMPGDVATTRTYYLKQALQKFKYEVLSTKLGKGIKGICIGDASVLFRKICGENDAASKNIIPTIVNAIRGCA